MSTIQLYETGTTSPLANIKGIVKVPTTNVKVKVARSSTSGVLTYTVDDGTYSLYLLGTGYQFDNPVSMVVSDSVCTPSTVYGTVFAPAIVYPDCCTIYGNLTDFKLSPSQDTSIIVNADMLPNHTQDAILTNNIYTTLSASDGSFAFYAIQGSIIAVKIEDAGVEQSLTVPAQTTCRLIDLLG